MRILKYFFTFLLIASLSDNSVKAQQLLEKSGLLKLSTQNEGVYKLDSRFFKDAGIALSTINPQKVAIYGDSGGMLPQLNTGNYNAEPQQLAIYFNGNSNSVFEEGEYFCFYSDSPDHFSFDFNEDVYRYRKNVYTDQLFFFLDLNVESPKRITSRESITGPAETVRIDFFHDFIVHEQELFNLLNSGRTWLGEAFDITKKRELALEYSGSLAANQEVKVQVNYVAQTFSAAEFSVSLNEFELLREDLQTVPDFAINPYNQKGREQLFEAELSTTLLGGNISSLSLAIEHIALASGTSRGWLDYAFVQLPVPLEAPDTEQQVIRNPLMNTSGDFTLDFQQYRSNSILWDVTDPINPVIARVTNSQHRFSNSNAQSKKFASFDPLTLSAPAIVGTADFYAAAQQNPDYVIISHSEFMTAARALAEHRAAYNQYSVEVIKLQNVYNRYSSGRQDPTAIRNLIASLYNQEDSRLKYVLLFGAGSFDYKNLKGGNKNFIPVYQSYNYLHPVYTYASDDYFGFLEIGEGVWEEEGLAKEDLDIGIGRIPAVNQFEAQIAVNKIIHYETNSSDGNWKNKIALVADDEDGNLHHADAEKLHAIIEQNHKNYDVDKLYLGSFEQEKSASSEKSPAMVEAIAKRVQKGALIINYTGHGAENTWADESILNQNLFSQWDNIDRLPLVVTATCEFGRHDNPVVRSGAEKMLLQQGGGAIGLLTTSRPVFSSSNAALNQAFFNAVFKDSVDQSAKQLGDIIRETKNNSILGVNNRNFILLGDPAVSLAEPENSIRITAMKADGIDSDTIKSLDQLSISGEIINNQRQVVSNFNGRLLVELYDKEREINTISPENGPPFQYKQYTDVLFRGEATIQNGRFQLDMIIPVEMNYTVGAGKISLYAIEDNGGDDANGFYSDFNIGGSSSKVIADKTGPQIEVFFDDRDYSKGDVIQPTTELLVDLRDENGISLSKSELNKGIQFTLDGGEPIELSDYFISSLDSYRSGTVNFTLEDLSKGEHSIRIEARDVLNNYTAETIDFLVGSRVKIMLSDLQLYPNPANSKATVSFSHNRKDELIDLQLDLISSTGNRIASNQYEIGREKSEILIDLKSGEYGNITGGLYVIRLIARSKEDNSKTVDFKKLIVID